MEYGLQAPGQFLTILEKLVTRNDGPGQFWHFCNVEFEMSFGLISGVIARTPGVDEGARDNEST